MLMKRFVMLIAVLLAAASMSAQKYFICTGTNVNVRTGPGKNYSVMTGSGGAKCPPEYEKIQLDKGELVYNEGVRRNGFIKVSFAGASMCWEDGWVSAQYLKPARKCPRCNGRGTTGRVCPECHGEGYYYCCAYTGKELCPKCGYLGYY